MNEIRKITFYAEKSRLELQIEKASPGSQILLHSFPAVYQYLLRYLSYIYIYLRHFLHVDESQTISTRSFNMEFS